MNIYQTSETPRWTRINLIAGRVSPREWEQQFCSARELPDSVAFILRNEHLIGVQRKGKGGSIRKEQTRL
jgi:hypothetical protein